MQPHKLHPTLVCSCTHRRRCVFDCTRYWQLSPSARHIVGSLAVEIQLWRLFWASSDRVHVCECEWMPLSCTIWMHFSVIRAVTSIIGRPLHPTTHIRSTLYLKCMQRLLQFYMHTTPAHSLTRCFPATNFIYNVYSLFSWQAAFRFRVCVCALCVCAESVLRPCTCMEEWRSLNSAAETRSTCTHLCVFYYFFFVLSLFLSFGFSSKGPIFPTSQSRRVCYYLFASNVRHFVSSLVLVLCHRRRFKCAPMLIVGIFYDIFFFIAFWWLGDIRDDPIAQN